MNVFLCEQNLNKHEEKREKKLFIWLEKEKNFNVFINIVKLKNFSSDKRDLNVKWKTFWSPWNTFCCFHCCLFSFSLLIPTTKASLEWSETLTIFMAQFLGYPFFAFAFENLFLIRWTRISWGMETDVVLLLPLPMLSNLSSAKYYFSFFSFLSLPRRQYLLLTLKVNRNFLKFIFSLLLLCFPGPSPSLLLYFFLR